MREPIPTWYFALVVVRDGTRFLVVHERKHGQGWYLPAGRVELGETLAAAAIRETLEETGVPIVLDGIVRVEHSPLPEGARVRVIFVAHPADATGSAATASRPTHRSPQAPAGLARTTPNDESLGAAWVTLDELDELPLRGPEVRALFRHVAGGAPIAPLALLDYEGAPFTS